METAITIFGIFIAVHIIRKYLWWDKQLSDYVLPDLIDLSDERLVRQPVTQYHPQVQYRNKPKAKVVRLASYRNQRTEFKENRNRQSGN